MSAAGDRRALVAVSLKLHLSLAETIAWAQQAAVRIRRQPAVADGSVRVAVLPTLPALAGTALALAGTGAVLGAQDLFEHDRGAWTGAVSGADLAALGCAYAEVGHAERRRWFGEDDRTIGAKTRAARRNGMIPLLCVGEQRRDGPDAAIAECAARLDAVLGAADDDGRGDLVVAYEPEWAIGADRSADPDHVRAVCRGVRDHLAGRAGRLEVLYGGSAGPGLLPVLGDAVDGLFLGRSAHDPDAFAAVLGDAAARVRPPVG